MERTETPVKFNVHECSVNSKNQEAIREHNYCFDQIDVFLQQATPSTHKTLIQQPARNGFD